MADLVTNWLDIEGPAAKVMEFIQKAQFTDVHGKEYPLMLKNFVPIPEGLEADDISDWCLCNWGTSRDLDWVPSDTDLELGQSASTPGILCARYTFETAWGHVDPWVDKVAEMHPDLCVSLDFD